MVLHASKDFFRDDVEAFAGGEELAVRCDVIVCPGSFRVGI